MLMAGLDGVMNKIEPADPVDKNIYDLPPEEAAGIPTVPSSLEESLQSLEDDHDFLLRGDVFTEDLIQSWLDYKWTREVAEVKLRPHPWEYALYYDL
jgi:glutamine synthetase